MQTVSVILTNRFAKFLKPYPQRDLQPYFSFNPPGYRFMPQFRAGHWDGRVRFLKRDKVPTGLFLANWEQIKIDLNIRFEVKKRFELVEFNADGVSSDRAYQNECVDKMIAAARHHGGGLILAATGSGKTRTAGQFFSRLVGNGCFIVDELTLLKQAQEEMSDVMKEKVGEVGDSKFLPRRITVATSQTLHRHEEDPKFWPWTESLKVNIIDEIHLAMNRRNFDIVEAIAPPAVFGLTATLELQKKHIRTKAYALTGPVCYEYPLTQGQSEGHLAKGVVIQIEIQNHSTPGDYDTRQFAQEYSDVIVHNESRNELICGLVSAAVLRRKFPIVLVERLKHLEILSDKLVDIPHAVVAGKVDGEKMEAVERIAAKHHFEKGTVWALLANKVFQKGIDIKKLDVVIDASAMKSKNRAIQVFGRGIRKAEGKTGLIHFDIADVGGEENRFEKGVKMRRSAFKKKGIPLKRVSWRGSVEEIFSAGEAFLQKTVKNRPKNSGSQNGDQLGFNFHEKT